MSIASAVSAVTRDHHACDSRNRGGRPVGGDPGSERTLKPWLMARISPSTYYRNKKAAQSHPQQHGAHVTAWFQTLSGIAKLEHRSAVRRALVEARWAARGQQNSDELLGAYTLLRRLH